jgi:tetratricopeptide (TPR) repeat protein
MGGNTPSAYARFHGGAGALFAWWGWQWGARLAYRDAVRIAPDYGDAHFGLGEVLARHGRWYEASLAFEEASRLLATNLEAHGNLTLSLARAGLGNKAAQALQRLIRLRPNEAEPHILLGAILRREKRHDEAIRAFRWAVQLEPAPSWRRFWLADAVLGPDEWKKAVASYHRARELEPRRPARLTGQLAGRSCLNHRPAPTFPLPAASSRGRLARRPRPARPGVRGAVSARVGRARPSLARRLIAGLYIQLGRLVSRRRPEFAIRTLRHGLGVRSQAALRPRSSGPRLAWLLALSLLGAPPVQGQVDQARADEFRRCLELPRQEGVEACRAALALGLTPGRAVIAYEILALNLGGLERWDEVVETYRSLVDLRPESPDAQLRLGIALLHAQDRAEEAIPRLVEAIRLRPVARAYGALGTALNLVERHEQAVAAFERALALDADYFEIRPAERQVYEASKRGQVWPPASS